MNGSIDHKEVASTSPELIQIKIIFWGPGESGKTTNFIRLKEKFQGNKLTDGYSIETTDGRTLWQDSLFLFFQMSIKQVQFSIITHVVTTTGQERFLPTREYVLEGTDGIIFVADSQPEVTEKNKRSFRELINFTRQQRVPFAIQLNKQDIKDAVSVEEFKVKMKLPFEDRYPNGLKVVYPASALEGVGVLECFGDLITHVIFNTLR